MFKKTFLLEDQKLEVTFKELPDGKYFIHTTYEYFTYAAYDFLKPAGPKGIAALGKLIDFVYDEITINWLEENLILDIPVTMLDTHILVQLKREKNLTKKNMRQELNRLRELVENPPCPYSRELTIYWNNASGRAEVDWKEYDENFDKFITYKFISGVSLSFTPKHPEVNTLEKLFNCPYSGGDLILSRNKVNTELTRTKNYDSWAYMAASHTLFDFRAKEINMHFSTYHQISILNFDQSINMFYIPCVKIGGKNENVYLDSESRRVPLYVFQWKPRTEKTISGRELEEKLMMHGGRFYLYDSYLVPMKFQMSSGDYDFGLEKY